MNIGILGSGGVARTLGSGFLHQGHAVMLGTRSVDKLAQWVRENQRAQVGDLAATAAFGDVLVLAVKGSAAHEALNAARVDDLAGKTILDATNPIADAPPEHGVLRFFTGPNESLMERLQQEFNAAHFVKVFNSVGQAFMVDPHFAGGKPTMFICGNDEAAKKTARGFLDAFGWETEDMGSAEAARAIEPLCMLWCIPGLLKNEWAHAFKLLR